MSEGFVVDTHLLRELGDLLVGRDSTAVLELVKNGYDADATVVRIDAHDLADPEQAVLTVDDNGNGMTAERFRSAFLRIAGRDKEEGERVSPRFHRAYTGQKGIGRLASQKLAKVLEVSSRPRDGVSDETQPGVSARIDWEEIDRQDRLDRLSAGLDVAEVPRTPGISPGTTLTMKSLKRRWSPEDIGKFVNELQSAQPPALLLGADRESLGIINAPLLGAPVIRVSNRPDPGFQLELSGELAHGDELWSKAAEDFQWCIEIDAKLGRAKYQVSPTVAYAQIEPLARSYTFEAKIDESIRFQARFYMMPNASTRRGPLKGFVRATSGIRVYLEGFRVLPYAEYGDDWLEIDRDYRAGARYYTIALDDEASDELEVDKKEGLNAVASNGYFGAVFLTNEGAPGLESLINREGFVPGVAFSAIRAVVQDGVRLSVRVRRSTFNQRERLNVRTAAVPPEEVPVPLPDGTTPSPPVFDPSGRTPFDLVSRHEPSAEAEQRIASALAAAAAMSQRPTDENTQPATDSASLNALVDGFQAAREALQAVQSIQPELRTLAGVGLQLGAYVHDINGMLASTTTIRELLRSLIQSVTSPDQRHVLQVALGTADNLAHTLARQSSYLTDVLSADPRRRRSQVKIKDRVDSVLRFLSGRIAEKQIEVHVSLAPDLRTAPMFPAEIMILLTNLLTNAVKNADNQGNIWIDGYDRGDSIELTISNDGTAVDLDEAERWFLPFESTTTSVDEVLGQGMGLGLPIVRALIDDYRGDVRFISPIHAPGTAVRIVLPKKGSAK